MEGFIKIEGSKNHSKLVKDVMPKRFIGKFSDFQKLIKSKL